MPDERLQKILAAAGVASRRGAEDLIVAGRVLVDGHVAVLGERADRSANRIEVDGRPIATAPSPRTYIALHKPVGVTATVRDRHATTTVMDLVPRAILATAGHLYPVGRLDQDSEGLILLTNDGDWAERAIHPRYGVEREYAVGLAAPLDDGQRRLLNEGIELDEGMAQIRHLRPATRVETRQLTAILVPMPPPDLVWYRATIAQGWKRQLRRVFAAVGAPLERLARVRIGAVWLGDLKVGSMRQLTPAEVRALGGRAPGARPSAGHASVEGETEAEADRRPAPRPSTTEPAGERRTTRRRSPAR